MPRPPPGIGQALEGWLRTARAGPLKSHKPHLKPGSQPVHNTPTSHGLHTSRPATSATVVTNTTPPSASRWSSAARSWFKLVTDGVFTTIKSSAYAHPHGPYRATRLPANSRSFAQSTTRHFATRGSSRPSLGPVASKQVVQRSTAHSVGLSNARGFASGAGQGVWSNIVVNVPLGLRALGNQCDVVDQRKWKNAKRDVRRRHKEQMQARESSVVKALPVGLFLSKKEEFDEYFASIRQQPIDTCSEEEQDRLPVCLVVRAEPYLDLVGDYEDSSSASSSSSRLLPPEVVSHFQTITSAYTKHACRIKSLHDNLVRSGAFDDPATQTSAVVWRDHDGREVKEVHVCFGPRWTVGDVRNAVGEWLLDPSWCRVVDLEQQEKDKLRDVLFDVEADEEASLGSDLIQQLNEDDDERSDRVHQGVANTFILPAVDLSSAQSLELSPPSSTSESIIWDDMSSDQPSFNSTWYADDDAVIQPSPWTEPSTPPTTPSYEQGLYDFLHQLDVAQSRLYFNSHL
ncbi:hypothetical protein ACM66B_004921 [Microbotryomycetes sp. NB124-2]